MSVVGFRGYRRVGAGPARCVEDRSSQRRGFVLSEPRFLKCQDIQTPCLEDDVNITSPRWGGNTLGVDGGAADPSLGASPGREVARTGESEDFCVEVSWASSCSPTLGRSHRGWQVVWCR